MHEMSIALSIVKIAEEEARKARVKHFAAIDMEIGTLAGIEFDALDFVWQAAVQETVLEKAKKRIVKIPAKARCGECDEVYSLEYIHDNCPKCASFLKTILQGKELRVKSLELFPAH
ncbi:MAG: hydrogenase maturation nickel metallochaperone HypA [Eudoraea sp.]|nr:hydrogenase maturation nickel metallochaperone HypA [Eudoraea sp.]MBT8209343.1 hydrogenase maturation nickel metallochaperone HypA [Eudoraea sp.]NNK30495.1 hydrogenase maturation nickel metallochaperone HypA [Flavobacteriaceae bacterium]